jgi:hypothetical protein
MERIRRLAARDKQEIAASRKLRWRKIQLARRIDGGLAELEKRFRLHQEGKYPEAELRSILISGLTTRPRLFEG